jgi:tetraacyldisaccharide 4'-kinase
VKLLASIFGAAVRLRNGGYDRGLLRARRLAGPVVSVGNLSVGGSGKTPFVILLGEHLKARSIPFDVLTRGYGRGSREILAVEPGGDARRFGDEPLLIARRLQVPVIVGADRYASGRWSEEHFGPRLHLLDDGFQHRQLARDFEIVMASPEDAADRLLPAGRLREPVASLRRTDAVVLAEGASTQGLPLAGRQLWRIRRGICAVRVPWPFAASPGPGVSSLSCGRPASSPPPRSPSTITTRTRKRTPTPCGPPPTGPPPAAS